MRRGRIPYSAEEMAWLEANYMMVISDYHRAFVTQFGRDDVLLCHLNQLRKRKGWKVGRDGARYVGRLKAFNDAEFAWLRDNHAMPIAQYFAAFQAEFDRPDMTPQKLNAMRKRQGWKTGRTGRFEQGHETHNKGKPCEPGKGGRHPNAQKTHFNKGKVPPNRKPLWSERVGKDGYIEMSVPIPNPYTGHSTRYMHKHRWNWEQVNGPLPKGHALKCKDGNRQNCDASNWEAIPRGILPRLNGGKATRIMAYDQAPAELKPSLLAVAKLDHAVSVARRERKRA